MSALRFLRTPAIEAGIARFDRWWGGLSNRERWLVGTLGALLAGLVLVFGIVRPLQAARADALADIRSHETLAARVRAAGVLVPPGSQPQLRPGSPIEGAQAAAQEAGLTVTLAADGDGVGGTVDGSYEAVLGWIAAVERTTPLRARQVTMNRAGAPGQVHARVEFGQ